MAVGGGVPVKVGGGESVGTGVGEGADVAEGTGVAMGTDVGTDVAVGTEVGVAVGVGIGADVAVGTDVTVGTDVAVGSGVGVAVGAGVSVGNGVGVAVGRGVAVAAPRVTASILTTVTRFSFIVEVKGVGRTRPRTLKTIGALSRKPVTCTSIRYWSSSRPPAPVAPDPRSVPSSRETWTTVMAGAGAPLTVTRPVITFTP